MSRIDLIVLLCGVGTFLLRWIPLWRTRRHSGARAPSGKVQSLLAGVGPAAIAALLVVSLWGSVAIELRWQRALATALALGCIALARRLLGGGIAAPTLIGAAVYGLLMH